MRHGMNVDHFPVLIKIAIPPGQLLRPAKEKRPEKGMLLMALTTSGTVDVKELNKHTPNQSTWDLYIRNKDVEQLWPCDQKLSTKTLQKDKGATKE